MLQQNARATVQVPSIRLPVQVSSNSPGGAPEFFLLIRYRSSEAVLAIYTIYHLQGNDVIAGFVQRFHTVSQKTGPLGLI